MSLRQKVDDELKAAMKASASGNRERLDTIRMLKSAVKYREIELGQSLDDAGVAAVVGSLVKQRRDSVEQFKAGGRAEQATRKRPRSASSRSSCRRSSRRPKSTSWSSR